MESENRKSKFKLEVSKVKSERYIDALERILKHNMRVGYELVAYL